jgi:hypothetical protein
MTVGLLIYYTTGLSSISSNIIRKFNTYLCFSMILIELHLIFSYVTKEQNYEIYNYFYYRICNTRNVEIKKNPLE